MVAVGRSFTWVLPAGRRPTRQSGGPRTPAAPRPAASDLLACAFTVTLAFMHTVREYAYVPIRPRKELRQAREASLLSLRDLAERSGKSLSTIARIEAGVSSPSAKVLDELLHHCGRRLIVVPLDTPHQPEPESQMSPIIPPPAPTAYPNPRNDDPWDSDAVWWLMEKDPTWKRVPLFECLRRQPGRLKNDAHRVEAAAALARRYGVIQHEVYDAGLGRKVVRLIRTDPDAPDYPADRLP